MVRVLEAPLTKKLCLKPLDRITLLFNLICLLLAAALNRCDVELSVLIVRVLLYHHLLAELCLRLSHTMSTTDRACTIGQVTSRWLDRIVDG